MKSSTPAPDQLCFASFLTLGFDVFYEFLKTESLGQS
jgi:hypothetical protein